MKGKSASENLGGRVFVLKFLGSWGLWVFVLEFFILETPLSK